MMEKYNRRVDSETASDIVKEVGGLPLAIRQIGCYLATTHADARSFLRRYQEREGEAHRVDNYVVMGSSSPSQCLGTVWDLTFSKLSPSSIFLLNAMVMLDPDGIPTDLFTDDMFPGSLPPYIQTMEQSVLDAESNSTGC
jgi:hypothetical protein